MSDEPVVMRKLARLFGRKKDEDAERTALESAGRLPTELTKLLNDKHHSAPVLLRKIQGIIERQHLKVDTAILEERARKINAGKNVIDAIIGLRTSANDSAHLDLRLERGEELAKAEHETKILEQDVQQARLKRRLDSARANQAEDDFEERARRQLEEHEDVLVAHARLESETLKRTDISESARQATLEWLKEQMAAELERRRDRTPPS